MAIRAVLSDTWSKKGGGASHKAESDGGKVRLTVDGGDGGWVTGGEAEGIPLVIMVATRTNPKLDTTDRMTDRLICR